MYGHVPKRSDVILPAKRVAASSGLRGRYRKLDDSMRDGFVGKGMKTIADGRVRVAAIERSKRACDSGDEAEHSLESAYYSFIVAKEIFQPPSVSQP